MLKNIFPICAFLLIPFIVSAEGKSYGVFVGISDYQIQAEKLPSSVKDAQQICRVFSANCGNGNTKLLLDKDATRKNILDGISYYQSKVSSGDLFLFYYSGHGTLFPDRLSEDLDENPISKFSGKNKTKKKISDSALVPFDSNLTTSGKRWRNLILDDELYRLFAEFTKKGARVVFISDSCYSGGQAKGGLDLDLDKSSKLGSPKYVNLKTAIGLDEKDIKPEGTQQIIKPENILDGSYLLIASSAENEQSYSQNPETGTDNSLFTYCLLKIFEEFKKNKKTLTFNDILTKVKPMVEKAARANEANQTPLINRAFYKGSLKQPIF